MGNFIRALRKFAIKLSSRMNVIIMSDCYFSGSAGSLNESRESTPSASTVTKRYESDIEVLSNPSQSSIEVLDDGTK